MLLAPQFEAAVLPPSMGLLKVMVIAVRSRDTPAAPFAGLVETTEGAWGSARSVKENE
jgi:hypothetical protein